jgi:predicted Zn-dependent protease
VEDVMKNTTQLRRAGAAIAVCALLAPSAALAHDTSQLKPGFNVFSVQQDVEIGRQSAVEAERQLPLLNDRYAEQYVNQLVSTLAAAAPGTRFPYQARVVNSTEINAFALPGGYMYVNRGLIQAARTEGELVGVLAHEMAHVVLRHGTHNASRAYVAQAGLGVIGQVLSGGRRGSSQAINVIGGLGLNALFLKYSRDAESQADSMGAQIMARAGYDPMEMANFFDLLRQQERSDPGGVAKFFSDHPAPADRAQHIRSEAAAVRRPRDTGELRQVQAELQRYSQTRTAARRRIW